MPERVTRAQAEAFGYEEATGGCGNPYCTENGCPENHPLGYPQAIVIEGVVFEVNWDPPTGSDGLDQLRALKRHVARLAQRPDEETVRKGHKGAAHLDAVAKEACSSHFSCCKDAYRDVLAAMYQPEEEA